MKTILQYLFDVAVAISFGIIISFTALMLLGGLLHVFG